MVASKRHREAPPAFVTADSGFGGGFKDDEKENKKARVANAATPKPKPPTENAFVAMEEDDDFDADLDALSAVERARAVAKAMKPHDPNAFRRATKAIRVDPGRAKRVARRSGWRPRRSSPAKSASKRGPSRGRGDAPGADPVPPSRRSARRSATSRRRTPTARRGTRRRRRRWSATGCWRG